MTGPAPRDIRFRYRTIDRFSESRRFRTLAGARRYARRMLGSTYDLGATYAVTFDGIGTLTLSGATWAEVLPESYDPDPEATEREAEAEDRPERERYEDDGREYGHPGDFLRGLE